MGRKASRRNERFEFPAGTICVNATEKAVLLEFPGHDQLERQWIPKSVIRRYQKRGSDALFYSVTGWFAHNEGLRRRAQFQDTSNAGNV